jgi:hypothetical protein
MKTLHTGVLLLLVGLVPACGQQLVQFPTGTQTDAAPQADAAAVAPFVTGTNPMTNATEVPLTATVTAAFSEAMTAATLSATTFTLKQGTTAVAGAVTYSGVTATFTPAAHLAASTTFTATVTTGALSLGGLPLAASYGWSFTTAAGPDVTAPRVSGTDPADQAVAVPVTQVLRATFTEAMDPLTIIAAHVTLKQGSTLVGGTVAYDAVNNTATFTPTNPLALDTTYTALVTTGATDLAGNALVGGAVPNPWTFTTTAGPETTAPRVSATDPDALAVAVPVTQVLRATFTEAMDPLTIIAAHFTLMDGATVIGGAVAYDVLNNTATFTPTNPLALGTTYTALVTTGATDLVGNALTAGAVPNPWTFTTVAAPLVRPTVTVVTPANATPAVALNTKLTATFSEAMDSVTITAPGTLTLTGPFVSPVLGTVTYDGPSRTATFTPAALLLNDTTYTATVSTHAATPAGVTLGSPFVWSFSTALTPDTTAPFVIFTNPRDGETGVAINRKIVATFNEAMDPATMIGANVAVVGPAGTVGGAVTYAAVSFAATFAPTANLAASTTYTVTLKGVNGVKDLAGNYMVQDYVWSFTTAAAPDLTAPEISLTNPADLAIDVPVNKQISATFTKPMDPLTISTSTFTLTDGVNPVTGTVTYDVPTNIATFAPQGLLAPSTTYHALVTIGATDLAGNALASGVVPNPWSFKTAAAIGPVIVINLGLATPFAIAATAGVTNTITAPITHINGNVVLDPNATCNAVAVDMAGGFGLCGGMPPTINGTVITNTYPDTTTAAAVKADLNAAFLSLTPLAGPPAVGSLGGGTLIAAPTTLGNVTGSALVLGDNWFTPGVYISHTSILIADDLTLDGQGDTNAIFIFQSASSLTTAAGAQSPGAHTRILLINGAKASNVWWQVASSATLGLYSEFQGNILAAMDITMTTGATACGRSMAGAWVGGAGAFVFDSNVVSIPGNGCPP